MNFISKILSAFTPPPPAVTVPPREPDGPPIHTIPDDNMWGHHIEWMDFQKRTIWGHFDNFNRVLSATTGLPASPMLEVGAIIRAKMQSGLVALFRVTKLDWPGNPSDMFFGEVEDIGYEGEAA